jgi:hypothetical protein
MVRASSVGRNKAVVRLDLLTVFADAEQGRSSQLELAGITVYRRRASPPRRFGVVPRRHTAPAAPISEGQVCQQHFHGAIRARSEELFMQSGISRDSPLSRGAH